MEQLIPKKLWTCFEFTYHPGVKSEFCLCVRLPFRRLQLALPQLDRLVLDLGTDWGPVSVFANAALAPC